MTIKEMREALEKLMKSMDELNAEMTGKEGDELKALDEKHGKASTEAKELMKKLDDAVIKAKQDKSFKDTLEATKSLEEASFPKSEKTKAVAVDPTTKHKDHENLFLKYMQDGPKLMSSNERDFLAPDDTAGFDKGAGGASMPLSLKVKMLGFKWALSVGHSHAEVSAAMKASTMVSTSDPLGGYTIPQDFRLPVLDLPPEPPSVTDRVTMVPAPTGEITMPKSVQTDENEFGGMTGQWINEAGLKPKTDTQFEQEQITAHEYAMHTQISHRLLSRSPIGMENWVTTKGRQVCINALDNAIISGDGNGKPLGFLETSGIRQVARNTVSEINYEDLVNLKYGLRPNHRARGIFVVNDSILQALELKKDNDDRPLFTASTANGIYDRLVGYQYVSSTRMPDLGVEGDIAFIDLSEYYLAMEEDIVVKRSDDYAFVNNVATIAIFMVAGGKFLQPRVGAILTGDAS
jgi:HK97 family phage major capsid protein